MKPDGTSFFSTADEKHVSPAGNHVTEPDYNPQNETFNNRKTKRI